MRPQLDPILDTIVALATPTGRSALALIRVSGIRAEQIVRCVAPGFPDPPAARRPVLLALRDASGATIDRGLVTFFPAPASATGEDVAELSVHGSPVVIQKLLAALVGAGARPARPGEFTERAFLLGKIDLVEAEAVGDLIEARTGAAALASIRRLEGQLSNRLLSIREELLGAAAALAATIDFAEDVGESLPPSVAARLRAAADELERLSSTYETGRLLSAGWRLAIVGRPNAGKSTLFNALAGVARAIVTEIPGTTRDTLEATIDVAGIPVLLIDTAGLRDAEEVVERIGVDRARRAAEEAEAVLYVFDASVGWRPEDEETLASLAGKPVLVVANKIDRGEAAPRSPRPALAVCGIALEAGAALRRLIEETLSSRVPTEIASEILGSVRQKDLVDRARTSTLATLESLLRGDSPEYAATHLDCALAALSDLVGETTSEDVLQRIFATFCIGK